MEQEQFRIESVDKDTISRWMESLAQNHVEQLLPMIQNMNSMIDRFYSHYKTFISKLPYRIVIRPEVRKKIERLFCIGRNLLNLVEYRCRHPIKKEEERRRWREEFLNSVEEGFNISMELSDWLYGMSRNPIYGRKIKSKLQDYGIKDVSKLSDDVRKFKAVIMGLLQSLF